MSEVKENVKTVSRETIAASLRLKYYKKGYISYLSYVLQVPMQEAKRVFRGITFDIDLNYTLEDIAAITAAMPPIYYYKMINDNSNPEDKPTGAVEATVANNEQSKDYGQAGKDAATNLVNNFPEGNPLPKVESQIHTSENGKYTFNKANGMYVVKLKTSGLEHINVPEWQHKLIIQSYSKEFSNVDIDELCLKVNFTRPMLDEYRKIFGFTQTSLPVSDEEILFKEPVVVVENLMISRRASIQQKFNTLDWNVTQGDADKWRQFKTLKYDPIESMLRNFKPTPLQPIKVIPYDAADTDEYAMLIGLSDLHFGAGTSAEVLYNGQAYSLNQCKEQVARYAGMIKNELTSRKYRIKKAVICVVGDILHTLDGRTKRGTEIDYDVIGVEQYDTALDSCIDFISTITSLFDTVDVHVVKGNHAGMDEYMLFTAVSKHFRLNPQVKFSICKGRTTDFTVGKTLCLMDHGDSDKIRSKVPSAGLKRDNYVQALLLSNPEKLIGIKTRLMIVGDMHHNEYYERNGFEFMMFGTMVTGDLYANTLNLHSRPRQNCVILDNTGVKETLSFYFD